MFNQFIDKRTRTLNIDDEVFNILNGLQIEGFIKNSNHKAFAFAYWWLVNYLWKYAKYGNDEITIGHIKEVLGYNCKYKPVDYIVKREGLLDNIGWTEYSTDYPIAYSYSKNNGIEYTMLYEIDDYKDFKASRNKNYYVKKPLHAEKRIRKLKNGEFIELEGTIYSKDSTISFTFNEFDICISNSRLGCSGFWLYSWLKYKSIMSKSTVKCTYSYMIKEVGFKEDKLRELLGELENVGLIKIYRELKVNDGKFNTVNSYRILNLDYIN